MHRLVAERLAGLRHGRTEILLERERLAAPVLGELAEHAELVVTEVGVGEHHQRQQLQRRHVLAVGGGVHGDTVVQLVEALLHRLRR